MSNVSDPCYSEYYLALGQRSSFVIYYYATPFYVLLSLFGHIMCIRIFFKQWKDGDGAYMFQIFSTVSEGCLVLAHTCTIVLCQWLAGWAGISHPWFQSCYWCMFTAGRLAMATDNAFLTTTQLFSTCLAVDRFRALCRPIKYKTVSKRGYIACAVFCISVGFSTSAYQAFDNKIVQNETTGSYSFQRSDYFDAPHMVVLSYLRNAVRILALLILYVCNIGIPYFYWRRLKESKNVLTNAAEQERRKGGKMLTVLTVSECVLMTICMSLVLTFYIWLYVSPQCYPSRMVLYGSSVDASMELTTTIKFYLMMALSKDFRKMIMESLQRFCRCGATSSVQPMINSSATVKP